MSDVINLYIVHSLTIVRLLTLDRLALWHKLLQNCVDGKMYIHNMYDNAKSCVRKGSQLSEFLYSDVGVCQERICPLFSFHYF